MPPTTSIRTFITALRTGSTRITDALNQLLASPAQWRTHPRFNELRTANALNGAVPDWIAAEFRNVGLSDEEIEHIGEWPATQKEDLRAAIVSAVDSGDPMHFSWEVHAGNAPATLIVQASPADVTFRSPRSAITLSLVTYGEVTVAFNPPGGETAS